MKCPNCGRKSTKSIKRTYKTDTRRINRKECPACKCRFSVIEAIAGSSRYTPTVISSRSR